MGKKMSPVAVECNICRSKDYKKIREGVFGNAEQNIYKCGSCGHIFLGPLPDNAEEERFYANEYPAFLVKRGDDKSATPEEHFCRNKDEAIRRHRLVENMLAPGKSILEIGSASGFFLDEIRPHVKDVCGVEPNSSYLDFANGKGVRTCVSLDEVKDERFDLIFLYYVLEHIKEPVGFIKNIKGLLKDAGSKIVVEVPNVNEALISVYRSLAYDNFVWQRAHCSYFSTNALKRVFSDAGFLTEFIPEQRYDISNHIYWIVEGKPGGAGKYKNIFSEALDREYSRNLKDNWVCDTILAIAGL